MPALLLLTGPSAGLRYEVTTEATLGRSPSCEIALEDGRVSRRHARVWVEEGQARVEDLGSRNGTTVNGETLAAGTPAILLPGDRMQVGETTVLFEPPTRASLADREAGQLEQLPVEELLPRVGPEAALYSAASALLAATSEAMVLRRAAEEVLRAMEADRAAALLGGTEGLLTAAVVGAESVEVPRAMARAALERRELSQCPGALCVPLVSSGGMPFGLLYVERAAPAFGEVDQRVLAALGRLAGEAFAAVRTHTGGEAPEVQLVGSSRAFRKSVEEARSAAAGSEPVVLYGESGTGKLLLARYIHARSSRGLGPLVVVDCRQPPVLVEEQLFGRASSPGVPPLSSALLRADGGTLVLRGLEQLPRFASERLARLLERRAAPAPGGGEEQVDVRVIATSPLPATLLSSRGELDGELVRLLAGAEVEVLPLRDRRPDIPALFELFALETARPLRREPPALTADARRMLTEYAWPQNVRELRLLAQRLALLYSGSEVTALQLPPEVQEGEAELRPRTLAELVQRLERDAITEALRAAGGKKIRAAELLGISRPTLDKKIEDYQLVVEKVRAPR